jgi:altronate dehydratase large subunit
MHTFKGYHRPDGQVGIRNYVICLPTTCYANHIAAAVAARIPGVIPLPHIEGNKAKDISPFYLNTVVNLSLNPNIYAVILIGMSKGDLYNAHEIANSISKNGKQACAFVIEEEGGSMATISRAQDAARKFCTIASTLRREEAPLSKIIIGTECGGSDALSGITANPAIGYVSDWIISLGGTSLLTETRELIGCENILANRAVTPELARRVHDIILNEEKSLHKVLGARATGVAQGNLDGGITNAREKALGCVFKGGKSPITGAIHNSQRTEDLRGLILLDGTNFDAESLTCLFTAGAHVTMFSSGCGSPLGFPCGPVIKICSNTRAYLAVGGENGDADLNAGRIITDNISLEEFGEGCISFLMEVLNGRETIAERRRYGGPLCIARKQL